MLLEFSEGEDRWAWPSNNQTQETGGGTATPPAPASYYYAGMYSRQGQPMFYDPSPRAPMGSFLPKGNAKPTPIALGSLLPMPGPYRARAPSDVSPNSRRSGKSQRPYSADVNQLFAVNEDSRSSCTGSGGASFKKGINTHINQIFREITNINKFHEIFFKYTFKTHDGGSEN